MSPLNLVLLVLSSSSVAIADVFLKEVQSSGTVIKAFTSPWMFGALALYLFQIIVFTYLFLSGEKLSSVGIIQLVCYATIVLISSVLFFKETATPLQLAGIAFALIGVFLLNL